MPDTENRRRSRIVDRRFQFGLAWRFFLMMTGFFIAALFLVFAPSIYVLATKRDLNVLEPAAFEFLILHKRIWPAAILTFGGMFVYTLFFSQRIAGPIYRINSVLRQMLKGEFPEKVAFREKDCFRETAELLTELSAKLSRPEKKA